MVAIANNNNTDQTVDRLDQNVGDRVRLFFRWQQQSMNLFGGALNPTSATTSPVDSNNFSVGYTHTLSAPRSSTTCVSAASTSRPPR